MKVNKFSNSKEQYYRSVRHLLDKMNNEYQVRSEEKESDEPIVTKISDKIKCQICNEAEEKYTCPRCKVKYCGVECYKKHNIECSEEFYKRNVMEELKSEKVNEFEGKKFRRTLKDYHDKINLDGGDSPFLSQERENQLSAILNKINEGNFDINKDLTPRDWTEFKKFLSGFYNNSGDSTNPRLKIWLPFWESKVNEFEPSLIAFDSSLFSDYDENMMKSVKEIEINEYVEFKSDKEQKDLNFEDVIGNEDELMDFDDKCSISINGNILSINREFIYKSLLLKYKDIPGLNKISKTLPDRRNLYTLCNILVYLVFVFRLYNGEVNENLEEILDFLMNDCKILYEKSTFESLNLSLNDFLSSLRKFGDKYLKESEKMVINDLKTVLKNKFYIFESFVRLYEMIHKFSKISKLQKMIKNLVLAKHKLIYYMSFIKDTSEDTFEQLKEEICEIYLEKEHNHKFRAELNKGNI